LARPLFKNVLRRSASGGRICAARHTPTLNAIVGLSGRLNSHRCSDTTILRSVIEYGLPLLFFLPLFLHCESKKQDIVVLSITSRNVYRFLKFFRCLRLKSKFAIKSYLNIPPRLDRVATLPGEISMFKKIAMLKE